MLCLGGAAHADGERDISVAVTISGSLGWVDMGQFSSATESYFATLDSQVEGFERRGAVNSHLALGAGLRSQLRLPRMVTIETGLEVLYHRRTTAISIGDADGEIGFKNTSIALPFALGLHAPVAPRLALFGSIGPTLILTSRSQWDYTLGEVSSFLGDIGAGFEAGVGAELNLGWRLRAVGQLRYRFAKSGSLSADGPELPPLQPVEELGWKGVDGELGLRVVF